MWEIDNKTDFAVGRTWVRNEAGCHQWIVAIKATFQVSVDGRLELAAEQPAPALVPEYLGPDGASSLRCDSDLGLMKPGTDVIVCGHAHAPHDKPVPEVTVGLRIGALTKVLLVRGENMFLDGPTGLTTTKPVPFITMPVTYERAAGGVDRRSSNPTKWIMDMRNPLGRGFGGHGSSLDGTPGPNVVYTHNHWTKPGGFGALSSHWSPRLELGGTYNERWKAERFPLLPRDFDRRSLLCSPEDQRPAGYLQGGETISLVNMHPRGTFTVKLPTVSFRLTSHFGFRQSKHQAQMVTVLIEPELDQVSCIWQSSLDVPTAMQGELLDITRVEQV